MFPAAQILNGPKQNFAVRSASSAKREGSPAVNRTTDMGHFTLPASTSSKPGKRKGSSTGAFSMAKVWCPVIPGPTPVQQPLRHSQAHRIAGHIKTPDNLTWSSGKKS